LITGDDPKSPPKEMKASILFLLAGLCPALRSEPIDVVSALSRSHVYTDSKYQISAKIPTDWTILQGVRWGAHNEGENTINFRIPAPSQANPSMYYALFYDGSPAPESQGEEWFEMVVRNKEVARRRALPNGDYQNDATSVERKQISDHPTLSYTARYTMNGRPMMEHFLYVVGKRSFVMFFTKGPPKDVNGVIPKIKEMAGSLTLP
jgi:hypothetical protein